MKRKASLVVSAAALCAAIAAGRVLLVEFFPGILQAMASVLP
jgi:hypothetical protein